MKERIVRERPKTFSTPNYVFSRRTGEMLHVGWKTVEGVLSFGVEVFDADAAEAAEKTASEKKPSAE